MTWFRDHVWRSVLIATWLKDGWNWNLNWRSLEKLWSSYGRHTETSICFKPRIQFVKYLPSFTTTTTSTRHTYKWDGTASCLCDKTTTIIFVMSALRNFLHIITCLSSIQYCIFVVVVAESSFSVCGAITYYIRSTTIAVRYAYERCMTIQFDSLKKKWNLKCNLHKIKFNRWICDWSEVKDIL